MSRFAALRTLCAAFVATLALAGCRRETSEPDPALAAALSAPFFIRGAITEVGAPGGYRVKGVPGTDYDTDQAYFRLTPTTEIRRRDGSPASASDLTVGREISLWITGPIRESYPVQVDARTIVIE